MIDETGKQYGYLTVLRKSETKNKDRCVSWICQCKCGNIVEVKGIYLRNGASKSCGCYQKERVAQSNIIRGGGDLTGEIYNYLTVLGLSDTKKNNNGKNKRFWKCQCKCGKIVEVNTNDLRSGHTKSCGCMVHERNQNFIDEVGKRYGKLVVLEYVGKNKDKRSLWKCKCDCGNIKITTGKSLRAGFCTSCGCVISKGEEKISQCLRELNINFIQQFSFSDLRDYDKTRPLPLYFDFAIFDEKNNLKFLIEYQGEQHTREVDFFDKGDEKQFINRQKRDLLKEQYCLSHHVKLIKIDYTDFNKINNEYIREVILDANLYN